MGDDEGPRDEQPQRTVLLNSYWIDRYPVTNLDYKEFVDATGHRKPPHWVTGTYPLEQVDHPVTNISWDDAMAYAGWAGKRLPTEAEWEKAARGILGQTYPWGDAFRKDNVNSSKDYGGITPVKEFPRGASPYGVMDMCGNVMEWCADWYDDDYRTAPVDNPTGPTGGQYRVLRGGFYAENRKGVRCSARHYAPPSNLQDHLGFRCAKTAGASGPEAAESREKPAPKTEAAAESPEEQENRETAERTARVVRTMLNSDREETTASPQDQELQQAPAPGPETAESETISAPEGETPAASPQEPEGVVETVPGTPHGDLLSRIARLISERPEDTARLVRTMLIEDAQRRQAQREDEIAGRPARTKVAILMISLGQETTAEVMKYLTDHEIEQIAQAIAELDVVTTEQEDEILEEFEQLLLAGRYISLGGMDFARGALERALGPRKARMLLDRITSTTSSGFYMLRNVDPNQIIPFISKEHPQTISLILSQLDANQAAGVLNGLPEDLQSDVAYRMGIMDTISPQVLRELEESLADELQAILTGQITEIGGPKAVAEILNRTGRSTEKKVLERLDTQDPELAEDVRNQMFVFDDIASLTDREIQMILGEVDLKDLAVALKGGSEKLQERIFSNVSEEVGQQIKEEMQFSGPVRLSDVEEVQLRIVQTVRQLEGSGQLTIVRGDSNDLFV